MAVPFNLSGAIQEVHISKSNKELIESLNRLTEEFYRTIGIMIYGRYISKIEDLNIEFSIDILNLIDDYFKKPTFDSWKRFGGLCIEDLLINGDKFAIEFKKIAKKRIG